MRKLSGLIMAMFAMLHAMAFTTAPASGAKHTDVKAADVLIPVGKSGKTISLLQLSTMSRQSLEDITNRKMTAFERLAFKNGQHKLRRGINEDGYITSKKLRRAVSSDGETGFHVGGFALGFFVGIVGVLIAYLINDDKKHNRVKWAWIGFGVSLVLAIIIIASAGPLFVY